MKKLLALAVFAASTVASAGAYAGDAGCGLGSVIIQKNSKVLQLFVMTTNLATLTEPLGITSGTSGCSANGIVQNDKEMQYFVEINNDDLSREMARGEGEKLQVLAEMSGCHDTEGQKAFTKMAKDSFGEIYPTSEEKAEDVISRLKMEMRSNADVQKTCAVAKL